MPSIKTKPNTKKRTSTKKAAAPRTSPKKAVVTKSSAKKVGAVKNTTKKVTPKRAVRKRPSSRKAIALPKAIIETSPITWSHDRIGPSFEEIQLAAYHRWLQRGGTDSDNWADAEKDLRKGQA